MTSKSNTKREVEKSKQGSFTFKSQVMDTIIRQGIGIDIAKASFTACICKHLENGTNSLSRVVKFDNNSTGFNQLVKWVRKNCLPTVPSIFGMEATGTYYELLAYHLFNLHQHLSVILPNKIKYYAKSLNVKSKTDNIDAGIIALMAVERQLQEWQPPIPIFKELRAQTRLYMDLKAQRTLWVNKQKNYAPGYNPSEAVNSSINAIISTIDHQILKYNCLIKEILASEEWLKKKVDDLQTIKGLGLITIAIILAETEGFRQISNAKQLASYAGYDIVQNQSGASVNGKTRISKKGNNRIRAALHFPALVASRWNKELHETFIRVNKGKPSKMIGCTALQRKILLLTYALWKNDKAYMAPEERK